jgi:hypothetical protein
MNNLFQIANISLQTDSFSEDFPLAVAHSCI